MNQKGIVLSGLVYALLVFFLLLLASLLTVMWYRQNALNSLKDDANGIYDDVYVPELLLTSRFTLNAGTDATYTLKHGSSYFAGTNPNNWIELGKINGNSLMWRIIKSDPEGIKIIYEGLKNGNDVPIADGRIDVDGSSFVPWDTGSNKWERPSDLSSKLILWYNTLTDVSNYVQPINWCIGAIGNNPSIDDFVSSECIAQTSSGGAFAGRTSVTSAIGMMRPSDYILSSGATTCNAYNQTDCGTLNYLSKTSYSYWTLNAYAIDSSNIWSILNTGAINYGNANTTTISVRPVLNISIDATWDSGNGTLATPYKIK
jgi:hypothetical protein